MGTAIAFKEATDRSADLDSALGNKTTKSATLLVKLLKMGADLASLLRELLEKLMDFCP